MAEDLFKSPVIQEIIMSNRIGAIALELSKRLNIEPVKALERFYGSKACSDLHDKSTGLYLYTDLLTVPATGLSHVKPREVYFGGKKQN